MFHWQAPRRDYASRVVNRRRRRRAVVLSKMVVVYNQSTRSSALRHALYSFALSHLSPPSTCHMINVDFVVDHRDAVVLLYPPSTISILPPSTINVESTAGLMPENQQTTYGRQRGGPNDFRYLFFSSLCLLSN
jgi:hypothetical protein